MNAISVMGTGSVTVTIPGSAISHRTAALEEASSVTAVTDGLTLEVAGQVARALQGIIKGVEKTRTEVKAPVLDLGKKIDSTAKDFLAPVQVEFERVSGLINRYQREQIRLAEEARKKAEAEAARKREEQERQEAEARRKEEEARKAAEVAVTEEQHTAAVQQAEEAKQQAESIAAAPVAVVVPVAVAPVVSGVSARKEWTFEVESIERLYAVNPHLCNVTPKRAEIQTLVRAGARQIPGLRIFEDIKTGIRS